MPRDPDATLDDGTIRNLHVVHADGTIETLRKKDAGLGSKPGCASLTSILPHRGVECGITTPRACATA